jgi:hypothetical protein
MKVSLKQLAKLSATSAFVWLVTTGLATAQSTIQLYDPLGRRAAGSDKAQKFIGEVIGTGLGYVGTLALVMFIWGGIQWMTSAGNASQVKKGKDTVVWAVLGLVLIFTSYMILRFVLRILGVN